LSRGKIQILDKNLEEMNIKQRIFFIQHYQGSGSKKNPFPEPYLLSFSINHTSVDNLMRLILPDSCYMN